MKKQFLNLGNALDKAEQKQIFGGYVLEDCYAPKVRCWTDAGMASCCYPQP